VDEPRRDEPTEAIEYDSSPLPAALRVWQIPGGYKVLDANGQSLAYARETRADADTAHVLTMDEARRHRQ
jgi:hypothetical protein